MSLDIDCPPAQKAVADQLMQNIDKQAAQADGRHAIVSNAQSVRIEKARFQMYPTIPIGYTTAISGKAGETKSVLTIYIGAHATKGTLPGDMLHKPVNVAYTAFEDSKGMQVARLKAAGADLDRVFFIEMTDTRKGTSVDTGMMIPQDLEAIESLLVSNSVGIWFIDPIASTVTGDINKEADVRRAIDPLAALAQRLGISIVFVRHFNKGRGQASEKMSGSHAWRDVPKSVMLIARDPETQEVVITLDKSNYSQEIGSSWTYAVQSADVATDDGEQLSVPIITGLTPTDKNVNEIINRDAEIDGERDETAGDFLVSFLASCDGNQEQPYKVVNAGHKAGYSENTIKTARKRKTREGIISVRKSTDTDGKPLWFWVLDAGVLAGGTSSCTPPVPPIGNAAIPTIQGRGTGGVQGNVPLDVPPSPDSKERSNENKSYSLNLDHQDSAFVDEVLAKYRKKLATDPSALDAKLPRMSPVTLEMLTQHGGMLKQLADREFQRRADSFTTTS
jgi:RecA-family ATPase